MQRLLGACMWLLGALCPHLWSLPFSTLSLHHSHGQLAVHPGHFDKNNVGDLILELFPQVIVEPWGQTNCQMCFTQGIYQLNIMYIKIGTQSPKPIQTQNE